MSWPKTTARIAACRRCANYRRGFALAVPHEQAQRIRDRRGVLPGGECWACQARARRMARPEEELDHAVRQIISRAVASEGVIDIFAAAGLDKPDISILSDEFLAEVRGMPHRNLAVELLQKLLKGELAARRRKNVVQARSFAQMLEQTLRRYQNRAIEAAQVIEELIQLARELREASARGETLGLSEDELAFYDCARDQRQRRAGCSATRPYGISPESWLKPFVTTSRSTGRCGRTCVRICACWSNGSCAGTATRPTSRTRRRGPSWSKRRYCPPTGLREFLFRGKLPPCSHRDFLDRSAASSAKLKFDGGTYQCRVKVNFPRIERLCPQRAGRASDYGVWNLAAHLSPPVRVHVRP